MCKSKEYGLGAVEMGSHLNIAFVKNVFCKMLCGSEISQSGERDKAGEEDKNYRMLIWLFVLFTDKMLWFYL